jgi:hypothetical protein
VDPLPLAIPEAVLNVCLGEAGLQRLGATEDSPLSSGQPPGRITFV